MQMAIWVKVGIKDIAVKIIITTITIKITIKDTVGTMGKDIRMGKMVTTDTVDMVVDIIDKNKRIKF